MGCSHTRVSTKRRVSYDEDGWEVVDYDDEVIDTCVDIDLHRFKCTQCGEVGYYSSAAKKHHEEGIPSPYVIESQTKQ